MRKFGQLSSRVQRGRQSTHRPLVELLEDRTLLDGSGSLPSFPFEGNPNDYVENEIIVRFRENVNPSLIAQPVPGASIGQRELLTGYNIWTISLPVGVSVAQAIASYQSSSEVLYAEPNYRVYPLLSPNDPSYTNGSLWGLHNTGQSGGTNDADIDAPEAWDLTTGSSSVVVAVIDTGVDYNHPDLVANMWKNLGEIANNGLDDDGNGYVDDVYGYDFFSNDPDPMDENNHGTHCAGTIGGVGNNSVGVVGVNWNVKIMALRFLGPSGGTTAGAVASLNYVLDNGILISSNSWGGGGFSTALSNALDRARSMNHVFVAAAGNNGANGAIYPAAYAHDNIISVAASDRNDNLAGFSNYGLNVDLSAPGVAIVSTVRSGGYASFNGTSMATPHVSGVVAMLKAVNPNLTYLETVSAILLNVDVKPQLVGKVVTGGRLNAFRSVSSIIPPSDTAGPYVISQTPSGLVGGTVSEIVVEFNENVDASTFTQADIVQFNGPGGVNLKGKITAILPNSGQATTFTIKFDPQTAYGTYTIVFGPDIKDTVGNKMNQDLDGNNGENPQDIYTGTFEIGDAAGARVVAHTPTGSVVAPVNNVTVTFDELIDATSFTLADIVSFTGPGGVDLLGSLIGVSPSTGSATTFTITFSDQNTAGDYSMKLGPQILDMRGNPMNQDGDSTNGETLEDQYTLDFSISSAVIDTIDSTDVPVAIKDRKTVQSKINVPGNFTIQDVNVKFWITHTWDADLRIQLQSPKGTTITLVNYRGGAGDNFGNSSQYTTMDDEATTPISAGVAPFLGTFRPENNNQLFKFDGQNAKGNWKLIIYDRSNGDQGTLNAWSLILTGTPGGGGGSSIQARSFSTTVATSAPVEPVTLLLGGKQEAGFLGSKKLVQKEASGTVSPRSALKAADQVFAAVEVSKPRSLVKSKSLSIAEDLAASFSL